MNRFSEILQFGCDISKQYSKDKVSIHSGWWNAPSTLQPLHEHHGKIACVVNIGRNKCHIHIKGVDKVYKGAFGLYVKYIA